MGMVYAARFGSVYRKAVALKLADHADDDGDHIFPSVARIAQEAEVAPRTVQYTLRALQIRWRPGTDPLSVQLGPPPRASTSEGCTGCTGARRAPQGCIGCTQIIITHQR